MQLIESDMYENISPQVFDMVVANLPYIPSQRPLFVAKSEPLTALYSGTDGLDHYRVMFASLGDYISRYTKVFCEIDDVHQETFSQMVLGYFPDAHVEILKDLAGKVRFATVVFR
ncbi:MAG: hypothetical protein U9Q15_04935 [Patescibacteria group bacterium]|nr:hypothetical protein [Patescibacteria group bacterium]